MAAGSRLTWPAIRTGESGRSGKRVSGPMPLSPARARRHCSLHSIPIEETPPHPSSTGRDLVMAGLGLPRNEVVQFGEHLVHLDPVLQILGGADVVALVDHDPAHVSRAVFARGAVAGRRGAAAMGGVEIGGPPPEANQAARLPLARVVRLRHRRAI